MAVSSSTRRMEGMGRAGIGYSGLGITEGYGLPPGSSSPATGPDALRLAESPIPNPQPRPHDLPPRIPRPQPRRRPDPKRVVQAQSVYDRVDPGGCRIFKKKH